MQTICTKFLPNTDRVKAYTPSGRSVMVDWNYNLDIDGNHVFAARVLKEQLGWGGEMIGGSTKEGLAFVWADDQIRIE